MRICLLDIQEHPDGYINRDLAGGYGSATRYGNSPFARTLSLIKRMGLRLPPLTLGYLAAIFHRAGHEVVFATNEVPRRRDLFIILSSIVGARSEMKKGDEIRRETDTPVCYVGTFASVRPDLYIEHGDSVIAGEPENAAREIAKGEMPRGIIKSSPVEHLDSLPFPFWDIFPIYEYSYAPVIMAKPFLTVSTSRGCPYPCFYYCPYTAAQGRRLRTRTIPGVMEELKELRRKYGIKGSFFRDPIFTIDRNRSLELADAIEMADLGIRWACETHLETLDEALLSKLYDAGLRAINVGIEGASEDVLKRIKRTAVSATHAERIVRYCGRRGIHVSAFYILGSPDDTEENIKRTLRYAKHLNTDAAQFTISTPYPGTPYYEDMRDMIDVHDWEYYTGFYSVFRHPRITRGRLHQLKDHAYLSYYLRPKWLLHMIRTIIRGRS